MSIFVFFAVAILLAGYISAKGLQILTGQVWLGTVSMLFTLFILCSIAMPPQKLCAMINTALCYNVLQRVVYVSASSFNYLKEIGYFYLGFIMYFSLCFVGIAFFSVFNNSINYQRSLSFGFIIVIAILCYGYANAKNIRVKEIQVPAQTDAKICFISDIHVGAIHSEKTLQKLEKLIDKMHPDMVLIGGDSWDMREDHGRNELIDFATRTFSKIASKYRTVAVIGNHEIYTGMRSCVELLQQCGIDVLRDESINIGGCTIIGRLDKSISDRESLDNMIYSGMENVIVLDHNPDALNHELPENIMLYLCGHTHGGQMFPINFITNWQYRPTGKLGKIGEMYYYISSGAGFWGPPFRIGSNPEVVCIELKKEH